MRVDAILAKIWPPAQQHQFIELVLLCGGANFHSDVFNDLRCEDKDMDKYL